VQTASVNKFKRKILSKLISLSSERRRSDKDSLDGLSVCNKCSVKLSHDRCADQNVRGEALALN
jgi:hypothetical protein